ncbi:flagellar biosynthesis protein FlgN [Sphingomonas sp. 37zxx]|uniref:flagellar biosynthesis protein FlgN n=1 Tax=Sphingomonas sp. 37zxx TaxID=1550073 RepID=UPI00053BF28C|nr:flagellar biosynthesis protein FlgN [Sphingomonas sp. 37zxx]
MANDFIDLLVSLTAIMEEETDRLLAPGRHNDFAEMVVAKTKLVGAIEAKMAQHARTRDTWLATLDEETNDRLMTAIRDLGAVAQVNASVLERQIDLSSEMMSVVATEARRLSGTRSAIYGASGILSRTETATPISINATL